MSKEKRMDKDKILKLLRYIDRLAADSRGCYSNARGNDSACYSATGKIRKILDGEDIDITAEENAEFDY